MSQIERNDGRPTWIPLRIASKHTLLYRSGPSDYIPQKNAPGKEIRLQWRMTSEIEAYFVAKNKSLKKETIEFLEKHWN